MQKKILKVFLVFAAMSAHTLLAEPTANFGTKVGFSAGKIEQEQTKEDYESTGKETRTLNYSGLKTDAYYRQDFSADFSLAFGVAFVTSFESLGGARSLKNGAFFSSQFCVLGGPRSLLKGTPQLAIEEKSPWRLFLPLTARYENVAYSNSVALQSESGIKQEFTGAMVNGELGLAYEYDLWQLWSAGAGLDVKVFGVPMSQNKVTDKYVSMYLSFARILK